MACTLTTVSTIDDLPRIRAVLLPHLLGSLAESDYPTTETDATDDDELQSKTSTSWCQLYSLTDRRCLAASESVARTAALLSTYGKKKKRIATGRSQWLRECQLAFSPTLDLLVIAFDQQIVVSTGPCLSRYTHSISIRSDVAPSKSAAGEKTVFTVTFDTKLQVDERWVSSQSEIISASMHAYLARESPVSFAYRSHRLRKGERRKAAVGGRSTLDDRCSDPHRNGPVSLLASQRDTFECTRRSVNDALLRNTIDLLFRTEFCSSRKSFTTNPLFNWNVTPNFHRTFEV